MLDVDFKENDLVIVVKKPMLRDSRHLPGSVVGLRGFIDEVSNIHDRFGRLYYFNALDSCGKLIHSFRMPGSCLEADSSKELTDSYDLYQRTLVAISEEAEERGRKYRVVLKHLSRKYKLSMDEIRAIYKSMLHYQMYYQENLRNKR